MEKVITRTEFPSRLGPCWVYVTPDDRICGLSFCQLHRESGEKQLSARSGLSIEAAQSPPAVAEEVRRQLEDYFDQKRRGFDLPLCTYGTPFERQVWDALGKLPYGETRTYGQLAALCGTAGVRAVGTAVGKNPLCVVLPCHRILPSSGKLGNYSGGDGPATKAFLLRLEGVTFRE